MADIGYTSTDPDPVSSDKTSSSSQQPKNPQMVIIISLLVGCKHLLVGMESRCCQLEVVFGCILVVGNGCWWYC